MTREDTGDRRDGIAAPNDWTWTIEDTIEDRVTDALRQWVEGLENSLTRGTKPTE